MKSLEFAQIIAGDAVLLCGVASKPASTLRGPSRGSTSTRKSTAVDALPSYATRETCSKHPSPHPGESPVARDSIPCGETVTPSGTKYGPGAATPHGCESIPNPSRESIPKPISSAPPRTYATSEIFGSAMASIL